MIHPRKLLDASFRAKVLVPVLACMIGAMVVVFFIVNYRVSEQSEMEARNTLTTANSVIGYSQELRRKNLLLRFHNLPNEPLWRQVLLLGVGNALHDTLRHLMEMQKVDIVCFASNSGKLQDSVQNDPLIPVPEFVTAATPALRLALRGGERADTVRVGDKLYDIVTLPAYDTDQKQIGVLMLGSELGVAAAHEFSQLAQSQIILIAGGHVIASTLPGAGTDQKFIDLFNATVGTTHGGDAMVNVKLAVLGGVHYYCTAGRFQSLSSDRSLGYILLNSNEQSLMAKHATQRMLLAVSVLAILASAGAVWFFINRVTEPLRELRDSAEAVGRGDFSRRVTAHSQDECGELAMVFNQMTENLQSSRSQLETAQTQLLQSEKLSALGEFVAGVAHELNNPLTSVVGFSEILRGENLDSKNQHYVEMIFKAAQRCQRIVSLLLSFARPQKPERKPVSVNTLVEAVLEIVGYPLRTSNIEVVTRLDPGLPLVMADGNQIQQVLLNVLNNARQAIEETHSGDRIIITTTMSRTNVRIIIQDNGPGIPQEILPRIFDPFFTTKGVGKGTGLGLSLCYGIIKEHGGTIIPAGRAGEGATFTIELPAVETNGAKAEAPGLPPPEKIDRREGTGKRVLVIDDEEPILSLVRENLGNHGYEVMVARHGEAGLNELKENRFDVTFCDWKMPGLNGRQVYERLRTTNPQLCRRMIFITGDVINEQMRRFLESEKVPCLTKPFALPELRAAIRTVLKAA
ncbi:MAG TPA: ATP-binding protein [Verrucomicrobiae bacterium]|nr:ATP-binding protein [Verrucomicrobiae bacterium]